ncbi:MAG: amidophosphoribosyltransferase, partial [Methylococcales bacterium]|nr:amidophosphoribosyltransferase [Methylococcales bacterium]
ASELIAYGRDVEEVCQHIGADGLIYQDLKDLVAAVSEENPTVSRFDTSVFNGEYVTQDVDQSYLDQLTENRNDDAKTKRDSEQSSNLEIHNVCHP